MEPAVRSPRIKSGITEGRAQTSRFWPPILPRFLAADRDSLSKPCRAERNFWMQRLEAKNQPKRPQRPPETEGKERYRRKSPQKRPVASRRRDLRFRRIGWWGRYGSNCELPTQSSNRSPTFESGTETFDAETAGRNRVIRANCRSRDCANQRIWQTCL